MYVFVSISFSLDCVYVDIVPLIEIKRFEHNSIVNMSRLSPQNSIDNRHTEENVTAHDAIYLIFSIVAFSYI